MEIDESYKINNMIEDEIEEIEQNKPFSHYYDEIDLHHSEILSSLAKLCRSNKNGFTDQSRLIQIREILKESPYNEIYTGKASIWLKAPIDKDKEYIVISSHADTVENITSCYSSLNADGYYKGTYDNMSTNAAAVITMLEADLPENVIFAFTSDEETGRMKGAKSVDKFMELKGVSNATYIALDVTEEGYDRGHLATVENAYTNDPDFLNTITEAFMKTEPCQTMTFVKRNKHLIPTDLLPEYLSDENGWCDEAFKYADLNKNTFSLCLPSSGNMHSMSGLKVRQPAFEGYIATLEGMLYVLTKTHEDLLVNKQMEKATLMERSLELLNKEKQEKSKIYSNHSVYDSSRNFLTDFAYDYYPDSDTFIGYDDEDNLSQIESEAYNLATNYSEDEETDYVCECMQAFCPDLYEQYMKAQNYFLNCFENYQQMQSEFDDIEKEDLPDLSERDVNGYTDEFDDDFNFSFE